MVKLSFSISGIHFFTLKKDLEMKSATQDKRFLKNSTGILIKLWKRKTTVRLN